MSNRLRRGVGIGFSNLTEDIATVQFLLSHVPDSDGGTSTLTVNGTFDQDTEDAIQSFQQRPFGFQDGRWSRVT